MTLLDEYIEALCDQNAERERNLARALADQIKARDVERLCRVCGTTLELGTGYCNFCSGMGGSHA